MKKHFEPMNEESSNALKEDFKRVCYEALKKDEEIVICLRKEADRLRQKYYGNKVYMRGLIEFTNFCKNNCYL